MCCAISWPEVKTEISGAVAVGILACPGPSVEGWIYRQVSSPECWLLLQEEPWLIQYAAMSSKLARGISLHSSSD